MKKIVCLALIAVFAFMSFAGCSAPAKSTATVNITVTEPSSTPAPATTAATTSSEAEPQTTSEPIITDKSLTTGLDTNGKAYQPIAVMVENSPGARPQTGLMEADIIYEAMAEGSITRFMCLFNDNTPQKVGPVRSARLYYINLAREWDAAYVHFGGPSMSDKPSYVYGSDSSDIKLRIDGIKGKYSNLFWRDSARKAPHNAYIDLRSVSKIYNYTPKERTYKFQFDANASNSGNTVDTIGVPFVSGKKDFVEFRYNKATDKFERYMSGTPFMVNTVTRDDNGKETSKSSIMQVQNVIIQYAKTYTLQNDVKGRRMVDTVGSGKAVYFVGGKQLTGTWKRDSKDTSTQYLLDDGSSVTLKPGNTWVCLQPDNDQISVTFNENGSANVQGKAE